MREYAFLKEPLRRYGRDDIRKVMLCEAAEGCYLFGYTSPDAVLSSFDLCYETAEDLHGEWDGLVDERGWIPLDDPLPGCQQDAFLPVRVRGRDTGKPEWGRYEIFRDGEWIEYEPDGSAGERGEDHGKRE